MVLKPGSVKILPILAVVFACLPAVSHAGCAQPNVAGARAQLSTSGNFNAALADRFADAFGLDTLIYEAPLKPSQFMLLNHFGPLVRLCNVRLEEILRVEIYRRGLHSDAFDKANLKPRKQGA